MTTKDGQKNAETASNALKRAALVLVSLDDTEAAALLKRMSPQQAEAITEAVANLREIDAAEQQAALVDFRRQMASRQPVSSREQSAEKINQRHQAEVLPEPPADPTQWPKAAIQASFDLGMAEAWAMALADCEPAAVDRVKAAISRTDRRRLQDFDRKRGPWRLDEPARARAMIFEEFQRSRCR
jgi:flagellar motor switch protein FliG